MKKQKLNEMRQEATSKEMHLAHLNNISIDCEKLKITDQEYLMEYIDRLNEEMQSVKENLIEVEAKNRLYSLLNERTRYINGSIFIGWFFRREHLTSEKKVRESRELRKNCRDDVSTLARSYHENCSEKEASERHLIKVKKMFKEVVLSFSDLFD